MIRIATVRRGNHLSPVLPRKFDFNPQIAGIVLVNHGFHGKSAPSIRLLYCVGNSKSAAMRQMENTASQ
jgi:hypothetical protein